MAVYLGSDKVALKGGTFSTNGTAINNQNKTVTPTTSQQTITYDSGYTGLGTVTINRIPTNYIVPSGNKSITANGTNIDVTTYATVSVAVPSGGGGTPDPMTLPTSTSSSATSGYSSKATISRSTSTQYLNIPPGYLSSGAYYTISATPNGTVTAPSSISGTSASVSHSGTTLTLSKTISVTPSVSTAGYISSGTAGNSSVSLSATDANFTAANIKKGVSIFGITGTYEASGGGGMNAQMYDGYDYTTTTSYTATDVTLTVKTAGTYDVSWVGWRNTTSGTSGSQLYKNGTAYGSANTTFQGSYGQSVNLSNVSLAAGDVLVVRARARSSSYRMYVANLVIVQTA